MNVLAVDTSATELTLAVSAGNRFEENSIKPQAMKHSEIIMPRIFSILSDAGLQVKDLDLLVCTRGPGSFTGLRIGMAAMKGLAFGLSKPLASVSTLEYHARTVLHFDGAVISAVDARKNKFYVSAFRCYEGTCKRLMEDTDGTVKDLAKALEGYENVLVVGPDRQVFAQMLSEEYPDKNFCTECDQTLSPGLALVRLGMEKYEKDGPDDIGQGPVYLRKSDAEIALEEKETGNGKN